MGTNFNNLLQKNTDAVERPKPLPAGTYYGVLGKYTVGDQNRNKTPYVRFSVQVQNGGEDVSPDELAEALNGKALSEKPFRTDFYLTDDSEYRLKEFIASLGVETKGKSFAELLPETTGASVIFELTLDPTTDGQGFINNIRNIRGQQDT